MSVERLNLGFKGERNYTHGSDIFNAINLSLGRRKPPAWVSHLAFRNFARRDCELHWNKPGDECHLVAQGSAKFPDGVRPFWVVESLKEAAGRRPFDEERLVAPAVSEHSSIVLRGRSEYSPIEEIIALTKRLNYELAPDVDGKWVFGQLDLDDALPKDYSSLRITRTNLVGHRFSMNTIDIDGARFGDIRFIVGSP
jgi:hypothetical protein